jgi:hypothetical protein
MNDSLSPQDLMLISSYLDDQLPPAEKKKVEARIATDPAFRSSVEELRYTRKLLRALPSKRAPRNFTLSAQQVPRRNAFLPQRILSFTSAAAAVLTLVVFVGSQFLPAFLSTKSAAAPMAAEAPAEGSQAFSTNRSDAQSTSIPPLILWNGQANVIDGSDAYPPAAGGSGLGSAGVMGGGKAVGTLPIPQPTSTLEPVPPQALAQANPNDLILGVAPANERGAEIPAPTGEEPAVPSPAPLSTPAILEISLGSLAVVTGVLAVVLRRRA